MIRHSLSTTSAIYAVSVVDTKFPPSHNISNVHLTLTSSLTYQKLVILLSYTKIIDSIEPVTCPVSNDSNKTSEDTIYDISQQRNILFLAVASVITLLATVVICIALKQTSSKPQTGFSALLPPSSQPSSPTFLSPPATSTPGGQKTSTPLWSQSGALKRTSNYNQHSPNRASPKFNMFSQ